MREVAAGAAAAGDHDRGLGQLGAAGGLLLGCESVIRAPLAASDSVTVDVLVAPRRRRPPRAATEFGLTVMIGVPVVTVDVTV